MDLKQIPFSNPGPCSIINKLVEDIGHDEDAHI